MTFLQAGLVLTFNQESGDPLASLVIGFECVAMVMR